MKTPPDDWYEDPSASAKYPDEQPAEFEPGIYQGVSDTTYHADRDTLSSTGARTIIAKSAAQFRWEQDHSKPYVPEFELGHAVHTLTLGYGDQFEVIDADSWRTKEAKAARDQAVKGGRTPLLPKDLRQVQDMHRALTHHKVAGPLFQRTDATPEQSLYWEDEETGVKCRARPDWAINDWSILVDYKTTVDASPRGFQKSVASFGYHLQAAWYTQAAKALTGVDPQFVFVVQEKTPPYLIGVYQLDIEAQNIGRIDADRARRIYQQADSTGIWSGYPTAPLTLSLPRWAVYQHEEDLENQK